MKKKHLKEKNLEEKKKQEEEETIEGIVKLCNSRSFLYAFLVKTSYVGRSKRQYDEKKMLINQSINYLSNDIQQIFCILNANNLLLQSSLILSTSEKNTILIYALATLL